MERLPGQLKSLLYKSYVSQHQKMVVEAKRMLRSSIEQNNVEQLRQILLIIPHTNVKAISWAVYRGHTECAKLLIEAQFPLTSKATYWALSRGRTECLRLLLEAGCRLCSIPMRVAARFKHFKTRELLIAMGPRDELFREAIFRNDLELVRALIKVDMLQSVDVMADAGRGGDDDIVKLLIDAGYPITATAGHNAVWKNSDRLKLLIDAGCPLDEETMRRAVYWGDVNKVKLLLDNGCPVTSEHYETAMGYGLGRDRHACANMIREALQR